MPNLSIAAYAPLSEPSAIHHQPTIAPLTTLPHRLRAAHSSQFQPFVPPSPASLGRARPARHYPRTSRWVRRLLYTSAALGTLYLVDVNPVTPPRHRGPCAHLASASSAERLFDLLRSNGGLYLKIGQAIAMQSAIMPPEFQKMFARMFDDAPQNDWEDVERVIREDFGKSPEEVFGVSFRGEEGKGVMEKVARASASVAQVHWARLPDGREVAIKVQKREIAQQ
ncbi:hypothetical protein VE04_10004, partial [Pseudogymnoascus sp. 24MN13]